MTNHGNELSKLMGYFAGRYKISDVFNDFLTMAICCHHSTYLQSDLKENDPASERLYAHIRSRYDSHDHEIFSKMLSYVSLQPQKERFSDVLGDYYYAHIGDDTNASFLKSPEFFDQLTAFNIQEKKTTRLTPIYVPACGSGRLILSLAKSTPDNYFFGIEQDNSCAKMTTLNLLLNVIMGEVACMDLETLEWHEGWHINLNGIGIKPIGKEQSYIWTKTISERGFLQSLRKNSGNGPCNRTTG